MADLDFPAIHFMVKFQTSKWLMCTYTYDTVAHQWNLTKQKIQNEVKLNYMKNRTAGNIHGNNLTTAASHYVVILDHSEFTILLRMYISNVILIYEMDGVEIYNCQSAYYQLTDST